MKAAPLSPNGKVPAAAPSPPAEVVEHGLRRALIVTGVMLAALLQTLDSTIVNVALPTIQGNLGASIDEGAWVVTAYIISAVVVIPVAPWLQLRFGRKQYFLVSIAGFTLASLACGLAGSIEELIVFRVVQGVFGGGLLATAQVILRDTFPPSQLGVSQSIYTLGAVVGPSSGPAIGGILTDNFSWRWVFDVNLVPGVIAIALLLPLLRNPAPPKRLGFDAPGLALLAVGLGTLQYVLDEGERKEWFDDPSIALCTLASVCGLAAFAFWETLKTKRPIVDLRVLARRSVAIGCLLAVVNATVVFGQLLVMPQYLTNVLGFTATDDGVLLALRALPILFLTIPIGLIVNSGKVDPRWLIAGGFLASGSGVLGFAFRTTSETPFGAVVPWLLLTGLGLALVFTPLLVAVLRATPPADSAKAGAFITLALNLGGSMASASFVTLLDRRQSFHSDVYAGHATLANPQIANLVQHGGLQQFAAVLGREAATAAYADAFFVMGAFAIALAPLAFALKGSKRGVAAARLAVAAE
jgi:DHA2 family multidrug resistance protein